MSQFKLLDGKAIAQKVRDEVKKEASAFEKKFGRTPKLAVILASDDPASKVYVQAKGKAAREVGIEAIEIVLESNTAKEKLEQEVDRLNEDNSVDGILVQLPLPKQHDTDAITSRIRFEKDVDGLHPINAGKLSRGDESGLMPCTPLGCIRLIEESGETISGKNAVVIGRSRLVGRPIGELLLNRNATVTLTHSKTKHLDEVVRGADILIAAIGKAEFIKGAHIKPGAVVVDVGINRLDSGKLVGDVDFLAAREKASWITPVPGGVGPMTIAYLLKNTVRAGELRLKNKA